MTQRNDCDRRLTVAGLIDSWAPVIGGLHCTHIAVRCSDVLDETNSTYIFILILILIYFPVSCHLGPKGPNGKVVLIRFVHVHKKYKTRVGDRQRKSGYCGILAQKVSVRPSVRAH